MNVTIDEGLFQVEECFTALDELLSVFESSRHEWLLTGADAIIESDWLASEGDGRSGKRKRESIEKLSTGAVWAKADSDRHVNVAGTGISEIPIDQAAAILGQPLLLIVENGRSDRMFVEMLIASFRRDRLRASLEKGFWKFEHAGGRNDVVNRIRDQKENRQRRGWRDDQCPRLIALIDCDSRYPGHLNEDCQRVVAHCEREDVPIRVLLKRTALNYLTVESLANIDSTLVEAYGRLTSEQRSYFNVKEGFRGDAVKGSHMPDPQEQLFKSVTANDRKILLRGLGDLAESFQVHSAFPKKALQADSVDSNEFQELLDFIEKHL